MEKTLLQRAATDGTVRIIVRLNVHGVMPEGLLTSSAAVATQRQDIADIQAAVASALATVPFRMLRQYQTVPFLAIEVGTAALQHLFAMPGLVVAVHEDVPLAPLLAESGPLVEADQAWSTGADGTGAVVAILDSGVDKFHPFLAGKVVDEACYSSSSHCPNGETSQVGPGAGVPCTFAPAGCRHGTHVAGIAAGNGAGGGVGFSGVARSASIMAVRVASRSTTCDGGESPCPTYFMSDVMSGLERVYLVRGSHALASVNISLGGGRFTSNCDRSPLKPPIDNLRSVGIPTVVASGNEGFSDAISQPACISSAVSVGSVDDGSEGTLANQVSSFSNSAHFLSFLAPGQWIRSSVPGTGFASFRGTSMATPHVAGTFAILKRAAPSASLTQMLGALQDTGLPVLDSRNGAVKPRIRIVAALAQLTGGAGSPLAAFVTGFYEEVLGRAPDPGGLAGWTSFLGGNCHAAGFGALALAFFDSVEFRTTRPLTLNGLVTVLYRTFLERDPEPAGRAGWAAVFREARLSAALSGFIPSAEFRNLVPNRGDPVAVTMVVNRLYTEILGREAEPAGLDGWVGYIVATHDLEGAAVAFLASGEFESHALTFRDYVTILYRTFLGRNPDPSGLDGWEGVLRGHLVQVINAGFIPSAEFQGRVPVVCGG